MKNCIKTLIILLVTLSWGCHDSAQKQDSNPAVDNISDTENQPQRLEKIEGQIRYGDHLMGIFLRCGVKRRIAFPIIQEFKKVYNVRHLKPRSKYALFADSLHTIQKFEYYPEKEQTIRVVRDSSGSFKASVLNRPIIKRIRSIKGCVQTTLYDAILELGESPDLIISFSDVFQWDVDFFIDPRPGDEFRIVYEKYYLLNSKRTDSLGEFIRYGRVLAGQYVLKGKSLTAIYFDNHPKDSGYYDLDGRSFQKTFLKSPLNYRRISSYFTGARLHPILKKVRPHYAIDYAAPLGTPVSAAADGTIIDKGYNKGIGKYIKIRHKNPHYVTLYGHLSRFAKGIGKGAQVKQRAVIGYVGRTGLATGPHLHYAFYEDGRPINPLKIKNISGDPILPKNRKQFERVKEEMLWRLMNAMEPRHRNPYAFMRPGKFGLGHVGMVER